MGDMLLEFRSGECMDLACHTTRYVDLSHPSHSE